MPQPATIRITRAEGGIVTLALNRPDVRNAIDLEMVRELTDALEALAADGGVRALIIRGEGGTFAGGADIGQLRERKTADALQSINSALFQGIADFPTPVIAAIEGYALGGGCELALACDLRIAAEGAKLGQPEVGLGIFPAAGGCARLPRLVGLGQAKLLIYTGRILSAREALAIGLVEEVVPEGEAHARAEALAQEIARQGALAVRVAKMAIDSIAMGSDPGPIEKLGQSLLFESQEKWDRMTAFLERRTRREGKDG